jgi:hypothetical protein
MEGGWDGPYPMLDLDGHRMKLISMHISIVQLCLTWHDGLILHGLRNVVKLWAGFMGNLTAAQVLYPLMQCTDVFFLHADTCQLGVDQRKVNIMLAREYCDHVKGKRKPIILSHHMLYGLK